MRKRYDWMRVISCLSLVMWLGCADSGDDDDGSVAPTAAGESPTPGGSPFPTSSPTGSPTATPDSDSDGYTVEEGDCDDGDASIHPTASEIPYDGIDQDCSSADLTDVDGDGYDALQADGDDCDDNDPYSYPGASEIADHKDNDCDGQVDEGLDTVDHDGDGASAADGDCDDTDLSIYPGAEETPYDGIDQDCSGADLSDVDGDGASGAPGLDGSPAPDCDDQDASAHPGATETPYDGVDQDCSGADLTDVDGDGVAGSSDGGSAPIDCDDTDADRYPGHAEVPYDGVDQDCSSADLTDVDGDGQDAAGTGVAGPNATDCDDQEATTYLGADEVPYDGIDQDCDGSDLVDVDGDGYLGSAVNGDDCDDNDVNTHPGASEFADGKDNDCDGQIDNNLNTSDDDGDGFAESDGDCNDGDASIHPGAIELPYDGVDQDCNGKDQTDVDGDGYEASQAGGPDCDDKDSSIHPSATEVAYDGIDQDCSGKDLTDVDGDGQAATVVGGTDCNDTDPLTFQGAKETPYDGIDQDCSGKDLTDVDGDGYDSTAVSGGKDCNDAVSSIHPGASEVCDGIDNNCDNVVDTDAVDRTQYYMDGDHDGYGDPSQPVLSCTRTDSLVTDKTDCDDSSSQNHPGASEVCDSKDNNCDGQIDEGVSSTFYQDADGDTYGNPAKTTQACALPTGYVADKTDCDDTKASVHPGATETCNLIDDDCDAQVDEGVKTTFYLDSDKDGYGDPAQTTQACTAPAGYVSDKTDCRDTNDLVHPGATELCNGIDDNCDGQTDEGVKSTWYKDADGDGYGDSSATVLSCNKPAGYASRGGDCDDTRAGVNPGAMETCNGIDDNCNSQVDDGALLTFYQDADGDGYGNAANTTQACSKPTGYVADKADCDDTKAAVHPGATETCNGIDDDCNGQADEGAKTTYYRDADADGYGSAAVTTQACTQPGGYVSSSTDCDDTRASVHPGATETCNALDDNCDGQIDEGVKNTYYQDADKDGYGNPNVTTQACSVPSGYVTDKTDCKDTNDQINPAALEVFNGVDDNCNGQIDEGTYPNCQALKSSVAGAPSGVYLIDPDGNGPQAAFQVYCDMVNNGGGWTLIMKINGASQTFAYSSAYWTDSTPYSADKPDLDTNEAKLASYYTVPFSSVMVGMLDGGVRRYATMNVAGSSMKALIAPGAFVATSIGRTAWKGLMANPSLQANCNREGFNVVCGGDTTIRIGITSNQENDCGSCDSRIGVGGYGTYCNQDPTNTAGNEARCTPDNGDLSVKAFGYVFVR